MILDTLGPIYVEPFLGAGATWLALLDPDLVALVSWMGGKRKLARRILALLGLDAGFPIPALLGDACWWGWVWAVVLDPVLGPQVCAILRSWRGEDPRALWFRLRDLGPVTDDVCVAAAQLLWLQARAASGVPVWWEGGGTWVLTAEGWRYGMWIETVSGRKFGEIQCGGASARMVAMSGRGDLQKPGCKDPALLAAPGDGRERQLAYKRTPASDLVSMDGHGRGPYRAWQMTGESEADRLAREGTTRRAPARLLQEASTQIDDAGQRQARDPRLIASDGRGDPREAGARTTREERLIATTRGGQEPGAPFEAGHKGTDTRGGGGIVDPGTIAARADAIRARLTCAHRVTGFTGWGVVNPATVADRADRIRAAVVGDVTILNVGARELTEEWAPRLGKWGRVYLDPPYLGATGYPSVCPREEVLAIAETWARHGAMVVVSEAVGLAGELGAGWSEACLREGDKPEWVTSFGCDVRALLPPLLRLGA